jgi:hypothetical protein
VERRRPLTIVRDLDRGRCRQLGKIVGRLQSSPLVVIGQSRLPAASCCQAAKTLLCSSSTRQ